MSSTPVGLVQETARKLRGRRAWRIAVSAHVGDEDWHVGAPDDVYEIGSVTKVFVGTLLADFVERGVLSLEDTVADHVPSAPQLAITLAQLASHTSGLPRLPANFREHMTDRRDPFAHYGEDALAEALARERALRAPGRHHVYSNYGLAVLGHVLSRRGGAPLDRLIRERICEPLELDDTDFVSNDERAARLVAGHTWRGRPAPHCSFGAFAAAGALKSTTNDLLRFLRAQTRVEHPLAAAFVRARTQTWSGKSFGLGLGWFRSPLRQDIEIWHTGATPGFSSYVGFAPAHDVSVVVLANHGLSLWGALVDNPIERISRRLLHELTARAGRATT